MDVADKTAGFDLVDQYRTVHVDIVKVNIDGECKVTSYRLLLLF